MRSFPLLARWPSYISIHRIFIIQLWRLWILRWGRAGREGGGWWCSRRRRRRGRPSRPWMEVPLISSRLLSLSGCKPVCRLVNYPKIPYANLLPKYSYIQSSRYDTFFMILAPASRAGQTTTTMLEVSRRRCLEATRPPARSHWTWKLLNLWHCFFELHLFSKQWAYGKGKSWGI